MAGGPPVVTPVQVPDLCGASVSEGEIEGQPLLTILNPPITTTTIFTTSSSSSGSISGLLDTRRRWIWLHSLGPTGANVLPSIHQAGWPQGGRLWSACADRRWMRSRVLLPIAIFILSPTSATFPFSCLPVGSESQWMAALCFSWRSHLP